MPRSPSCLTAARLPSCSPLLPAPSVLPEPPASERLALPTRPHIRTLRVPSALHLRTRGPSRRATTPSPSDLVRPRDRRSSVARRPPWRAHHRDPARPLTPGHTTLAADPGISPAPA